MQDFEELKQFQHFQTYVAAGAHGPILHSGKDKREEARSAADLRRARTRMVESHGPTPVHIQEPKKGVGFPGPDEAELSFADTGRSKLRNGSSSFYRC